VIRYDSDHDIKFNISVTESGRIDFCVLLSDGRRVMNSVLPDSNGFVDKLLLDHVIHTLRVIINKYEAKLSEVKDET
jgi:hypothetical protein